MYRREHVEPDIAIEATKICEIQLTLEFSRRNLHVVTIIQPNSQEITFTKTQCRCDIERKWQIATVTGTDLLSVKPNLRHLHGAVEPQIDDAIRPALINFNLTA